MRDNPNRFHPDLVPWEELSEGRRDIDRRLVQAIPSLLAAAGLELTEAFRPGASANRRARILREPLLRFRTVAPHRRGLGEIPPWLR